MTSIRARLSQASPELKTFAAASLVMGMSASLVDSTLNNFLNENFNLNEFARSFLEFPREMPGFLTMFVAAALWFLCSRRQGAVSMLLAAVGVLGIGLLSKSYAVMVIFLFILSMGQHLAMPVASSLGMDLARDGKTGQRLGQLNAIRNFATILGSAVIFLGFRYLNFTFTVTFILSGVGYLIAAGLMFSMKPTPVQKSTSKITLRKEYKLYYLLAVLYGSRKQLFLTFGPWVIVTVFKQPTQTLAALMTIGGVIGILFQPALGWAVDKLGERKVLIMEAGMLVVVCLAYGFARQILPENLAFILTCVCYLLDQMLMSVNMARSTYMKKIALRPEDVQPALASGVTIDHIFSIGIALLGGAIWNTFGYQYVFLMGAGIAVLNFLAARQVRVPETAVIASAEIASLPQQLDD